MKDIKIKLCGMMRKEDIEAVNDIMPDYIGFIFANTRRKISYDKALAFKNMLNESIKAVGVFVDEEVSGVAKLVNDDIIDIVQLHGNEDNAYIAKLKSLCNKKSRIIKAARVRRAEDIIMVHDINADYLLLDAYSKSLPGGTGESFNWDMINSAYDSIPEYKRKPYFLAGGINIGNIDEAVSINPYGVDISSGIETEGMKDKTKMTEIVRRIRHV